MRCGVRDSAISAALTHESGVSPDRYPLLLVAVCAPVSPEARAPSVSLPHLVSVLPVAASVYDGNANHACGLRPPV